MCLSATTIDQRTDQIFALLHAARLVAAGHIQLETHRQPYAGVIALVEEIERGLNDFAAELKAACPPQN